MILYAFRYLSWPDPNVCTHFTHFHLDDIQTDTFEAIFLFPAIYASRTVSLFSHGYLPATSTCRTCLV